VLAGHALIACLLASRLGDRFLKICARPLGAQRLEVPDFKPDCPSITHQILASAMFGSWYRTWDEGYRACGLKPNCGQLALRED